VVSRNPDDEPGSDEARRATPVRSPAPEKSLQHAAPGEPEDEPPVVARLVVEIRSDGRRTIARGALEDVQQGERVAVEARGSTPLSLAMGLMRSILATPMLARAASRKLLGRPRSR
jgi:hypothetical protein